MEDENTNTTPQSTTPSNSGMVGNLPAVPSYENLTKSIAMAESGSNGSPDYEAVGDNGTSSGAYQWQPGNYAAEAQEAGIDPDDFSPQAQNEVAYSQVYKKAKEGWTPQQIAASWNAGNGAALSGKWQTNVGTTDINGKQISYDTPTYVNKVADYYKQFQGSTGSATPTASATSPTSQTTPEQSSGGFLSGVSWPWKIALTTLGIGGLAALNFIPGLGEAADAGAADVAGGATTEGAAEGGGLLSKLGGLVKTAGISAATDLGVNQGVGAISSILGGGQSQTGSQPTPEQPVTIPQPQEQTQQPAGNPQKQNQQSSFTPLSEQDFTQSNDASQQVANATTEALQQTPTGSIFSQTPEATNGIKFNSLYGIAPDGTQGAYDIAAALEKSQGLQGDLDEAKTDVVNQGQGSELVNVDDSKEYAKARMRSDGYTPKSEWEDGDRAIDEEYRKYFGDISQNGMVTGAAMNGFRKEQGKLGRFDIKNPMASAKRNAHRSMNRAADDTILKTIKDADRRHLYTTLTEHQKGLYDGQKVLKKLKGKKAHPKHALGGKIARQLAQAAEIAIGAKVGGPVGAVVGAFVGHQLNKVADKKFGKSVLDQPAIKKALEMADKRSPHIRQIVEEVLKQKTAQALARPRLNSPSYIPMGAKTQPQSSVKVIPAQNAVPERLKLPAGAIPMSAPQGKSGVTQPQKPGGLYEHIQNVEASRKVALGKYATNPSSKTKQKNLRTKRSKVTQ